MPGDTLQSLLDKQAITELLYRYARGWDRRDEALLRSCFDADSEHEHGPFSGKSQDLLTDWLAATGHVTAMTHLINNILIEVTGDSAVSESHYFAHHRREPEGGPVKDWFVKGRYLDRYVRKNGQWIIIKRSGLMDFERLVDPADESYDTLLPQHKGQFGEADQSHGLFAGLMPLR